MKKVENRKKIAYPVTEKTDIKDRAKGKRMEIRNKCFFHCLNPKYIEKYNFKAVISYQYLDIQFVGNLHRVESAKVGKKKFGNVKNGYNG